MNFGRTHPFITDKYIDVVSWFNIMQKIDSLIKRVFDKEVDWKETKGKIMIENVTHFPLTVKYKFLPKEDSKIDFKKYKYELDWILSVKIFNSSSPKESITKRDLKQPTEPIDIEESFQASYSKKVQKENNVITINSQEMDFESSIKCNTISVKKAKSSPCGSTSSPLRSKSSERNNENKPKVTTRAQSIKLEDESQSGCIKIDDSEEIIQQQKRPRVSRAMTKTGTLDTWLGGNTARELCSDRVSVNVTKRKKERKISEKSPEKTKSQLIMDPEQKEKLETFLEMANIKEAEEESRKEKLKDLKIEDCHDLTNQQLRDFLQLHKDKILSLFTTSHRARTIPIIDHNRFDGLMLTTSDTFTCNQQLFVLGCIEKMRDKDVRGSRDDILHEVVLPYITVVIFKEKFNLTIEEALNRIKLQEEKKKLFRLNSEEDGKI